MNRIISMGELRLALRLIVKQPILSATIILSLATGICLATMGFTFRDELLHSTLPYRAGERIARVFAFSQDGGRADLDVERYLALRDRAASFAHVGLVSGRPFSLMHGPGDVESITGGVITARTMPWLDAVPVAGRTFIPADGEPGAERVVLMRESLWYRRYSGDRALIGRQVTINGQPRTVVGIMPDAFEFPNSCEMWLPFDESTLGAAPQVTAMVGLRTRRPQAGRVLRGGHDRSQRAFGTSAIAAPPRTWRACSCVRSRRSPDQADFTMSALVFVLVMVLMVVASNVATLVFARTWSRAPELAVRTALGAARRRVVGQLFFETLMLGSIAAVIGLAGAHAAFDYIKGSFEGRPFWITLEPNPRTMAFVVLLTLLVSAVSGLWPALRVTRHDLRNTLQAGPRFRDRRLRPHRRGSADRRDRAGGGAAERRGDDGASVQFAHRMIVPALPKGQVLTAEHGPHRLSGDARQGCRQRPPQCRV